MERASYDSTLWTAVVDCLIPGSPNLQTKNLEELKSKTASYVIFMQTHRLVLEWDRASCSLPHTASCIAPFQSPQLVWERGFFTVGDTHGIDYLRPAPPSYCEQHGGLGRRLSRRTNVNISHISLLPLSQRRLHLTVL